MMVRRVILANLLVPVAAYLVWDAMETRALRRQVAAIAARGEPVTLEGEPAGADTVERRDAARIYAAAAERQRAMSQDLTFRIWSLDVDGLPAPDLTDLEAKYRPDAPALQLLDQATPLDFNGFGDVVDDVDRTQQFLVLLGVLADIRADIHSARGRSDPAIDSLIAAARLERTLSSTFNRSLATSRLLASVRILLRHTAPADAALARLQIAIASLPDNDDLIAEAQRHRARFLDELSRPPDGPGEAIARRIMRPWNAREAQLRLQAYDEVLAVAARPWPQKLAGGDAIERKLQGLAAAFQRPNMFRLLIHPYGPALIVIPLGQAALELAARRVAIAALAVERYRRAHGGNTPPSLQALVPAYLPAVPLDPFSGDALIYRAEGEDYLLYSVDTDRKDDGGAVYGVGAKGPMSPRRGVGRDLGLRVAVR